MPVASVIIDGVEFFTTRGDNEIESSAVIDALPTDLDWSLSLWVDTPEQATALHAAATGEPRPVQLPDGTTRTVAIIMEQAVVYPRQKVEITVMEVDP